jgi:glyoxylase I family protein
MSNSSKVTRRTAIRVAMAGAAAVATGAAKAPRQATGDMERVQGIGGFFFRARDPRKLAEWYEANLGVAPVPQKAGATPWRTTAGTTAFAPFKEDTSYFGDRRFQWMINFRVGNLDKMVAQLRERGIAVDVDPQAYPNGRFARLTDPEGNPIQLWQAEGKDRG